jgi:hypothetical protein
MLYSWSCLGTITNGTFRINFPHVAPRRPPVRWDKSMILDGLPWASSQEAVVPPAFLPPCQTICQCTLALHPNKGFSCIMKTCSSTLHRSFNFENIKGRKTYDCIDKSDWQVMFSKRVNATMIHPILNYKSYTCSYHVNSQFHISTHWATHPSPATCKLLRFTSDYMMKIDCFQNGSAISPPRPVK